ncbi:PAS domain-containing sensor histidine kinase [Neokomagataea tanensis]|nr:MULTISPECIES: PAS domain-containing protein [Neokomagataea]
MFDLIAEYDWSTSPLGARIAWSDTLRITVDTMLASLHPMCLIWGPKRILLYNDGYAPILGARHPSALGKVTAEVWPELWDDIKPLVDRTFAGKSIAFHDQSLAMTRNGFVEETWYDFAYSPVRGDDGEVVGLLNITADTTARVRAYRERDAVAAELAANEAKWRGLFETLEEGFILGEVVRAECGRIVDWRHQEVNNAWYDLMDVAQGCAVGRTIREIFTSIEDEWVSEFARVVETGEAIRFTRQVGNLQRWYDGVCQPAGGDRFTVIFLEVTNRVRSEQRREALVELGGALEALDKPEDVLRAVAAIVGRTLAVRRVGYGTIGADGETLTVSSDWTVEGYPTLAGTYRMDEYGGYAEDLRQGRTVVIHDIRQDARTFADTESLESVAVRSLINRPIMEKGRTVAVLYVNDDRPRKWTPGEVEFVIDAANRTRASLERRRVEAEARETAVFLQSVLAASTDCIKVVELDGTLSFMSDGGMKVMEIGDFNAVRGCPWPQLLRMEGPAYAREAIEAAKRGETTHFEAPADTFLGTAKHWSISVSPIPGPDGEVARILSVSRDHTALEQAREQQRLLNGELSHRLKNVLTLVQAIANQTLRDADSVEEASAAFSSRLVSLGRATDALTACFWHKASMHNIVEAGLSAFPGVRGRISVAGPGIDLNPQAAMALTLALHELTTNAYKYGALSQEIGSVILNWQLTDSEGGYHFSLLWRELNGPVVSPPTRKGFGSRMIERALRSYFRGKVELIYPPSGVEFRLDAPLGDAGAVTSS